MNKITILSEDVAAKIAAGEVIERPAGVLKELLENAVDAGATHINVDIDGSGKTLIRVNDNGGGMDKEDLKLSVARHSTSKIKNFEDLDNLNTFGFRGEALYSVAAVSKLTISSCVKGGGGNKITVEGGKFISVSPAPDIAGTTVEVRDIFFNTPARLKFLKSDAYERALLLKTVEESALANLNVNYTVRTDGKQVYNLNEPDILKRAEQILGKEVAGSMFEIKDMAYGFHAFVTPLNKLTSVRDLQFCFINKRPLSSKTLQQAVYKAYQGRPKEKHPAFIIYMTMPPSDFDVNIHPQKREVKFLRENAVFGFIMNTLGRKLSSSALPEELLQTPPVLTISGNKTESSYVLKESFEREIFSGAPLKTDYGVKDFEEPAPYNVPSEITDRNFEKPKSSPPQDKPAWWQGPYRFLGAAHKTFLVFETERGLTLLDQHAARERVLYEKYMRDFDGHNVGIQPLMFPVQADMPASNVENLMLWAPWLKTAGFEISQFSSRTVLVGSVPNVFRFKEDNLRDFIVSLGAITGDPLKSSDTLKKKTVAMLACKKSIKAKEDISAAEAEALMLDLAACEDGMHCPHGRPVMVNISAAELAKKLGR
ncbi:MAG: DNA mismatch repair endonuclease MutL [Elusimicrobium sp.]|jgi:DNA mismatch repair protein MutL|nr:DNA mismatch repair endonuclease MutL [Elusimicrobium sp.]